MLHNEAAVEKSLSVGEAVWDERGWYVLAHLSVFVNLVTGFLGPVVALVLRFTQGRRSRGVGRHAMRAFWNQVLWLLLVAPVGFVFTFSLTLLLPIPEAFLLVVFLAVAAAWLAVPFAEGAWAAYRSSQGHDYRYLLDRVTSVGGHRKAGHRRKSSHAGVWDDDTFDLSDDYGSSGDDFGGSDDGGFFGGDSSGGDFFGGDSGSW